MGAGKKNWKTWYDMSQGCLLLFATVIAFVVNVIKAFKLILLTEPKESTLTFVATSFFLLFIVDKAKRAIATAKNNNNNYSNKSLNPFVIPLFNVTRKDHQIILHINWLDLYRFHSLDIKNKMKGKKKKLIQLDSHLNILMM